MNKPTVCVDIDGVLAQPNWGPGWKIESIGQPYPGAVEFLHTLAEKARVVIHSCRGTEAIAPGMGARHLSSRFHPKPAAPPTPASS